MRSEAYNTKFRALENFHIVLWLMKDLCWCMLWKPFALFMILPTFIFAVVITYYTRQNKSELFHNLAILMWIIANSVWMIGEFYFKDGLKEIAFIFFMIGLLLVGYYYITSFFQKRE